MYPEEIFLDVNGKSDIEKFWYFLLPTFKHWKGYPYYPEIKYAPVKHMTMTYIHFSIVILQLESRKKSISQSTSSEDGDDVPNGHQDNGVATEDPIPE